MHVRPRIEPRNTTCRSADAVHQSRRQHGGDRRCEIATGSAQSEARCTYGTSLRENREIPITPRIGSRRSILAQPVSKSLTARPESPTNARPCRDRNCTNAGRSGDGGSDIRRDPGGARRSVATHLDKGDSAADALPSDETESRGLRSIPGRRISRHRTRRSSDRHPSLMSAQGNVNLQV